VSRRFDMERREGSVVVQATRRRRRADGGKPHHGFVVIDDTGRVRAYSLIVGGWLAAGGAARLAALVRDQASELLDDGVVIGRRRRLARPGGGDALWLWVLAFGPRLPSLSSRQNEVAARVASGATNAEVAREIGIGEETVKTHVRRIYAVLGVANRLELAQAWWRGGSS
jgi:DNA-binding CsgD family transcriptional regulator